MTINPAITILTIFYSLIIILFIRNSRVYAFKGRLLKTVSSMSKKDIEAGKDFVWRYDEYEKVSYNKMLFMFWIPLNPENWWDDTSFLK